MGLRTMLLLMLLAALAQGAWVESTLDAPGGDIGGLGWENGSLWAVDRSLDRVYEIDPSSGEVIQSFDMSISSSQNPTGLAVENGVVYVGTWDNSTTGYVYKYNLSGGYQGVVSMCGG